MCKLTEYFWLRTILKKGSYLLVALNVRVLLRVFINSLIACLVPVQLIIYLACSLSSCALNKLTSYCLAS